MESSMKAIGFSNIDDKYTIDDLIEEILDSPTVQCATKIEGNRILAEYVKDFGSDTYIRVRVAVEKDGGKPSIEVLQCEPSVKAKNNLRVQGVEVETVDDEDDYYVICEHQKTSMQVIFWLQNAVEYLENKRNNKVCTSVNITALADEGTIILPVEKSEEDEVFEREERDKLRNILEQMKNGDEEASQILEEEEKELDNQLKQRLREEDFLTIMSGYFIPVTMEDGVYAILGEIKGIDKRVNKKTKESFYVFDLNVNDMPLEIAINCDTLIGMPSIGMRFMGTCWIQGKVIME